MTPAYFALNMTFILSILGLSFHRTHLISALLCIESMMLAMFIIISMLVINLNTHSAASLPIILLAFSACEAGMGLGLLVATSRTHHTDHLTAMNILQC